VDFGRLESAMDLEPTRKVSRFEFPSRDPSREDLPLGRQAFLPDFKLGSRFERASNGIATRKDAAGKLLRKPPDVWKLDAQGASRRASHAGVSFDIERSSIAPSLNVKIRKLLVEHSSLGIDAWKRRAVHRGFLDAKGKRSPMDCFFNARLG